MKKIKVIIVTIFMISIFLSINGYAATINNWMENVSDEKYLSDISIPGTHDSGALYEPVKGIAKCQNLKLGEQLNVGVRYLDIRCREYEDFFVIHHGSIYQHLNFDDVINTCTDFLSNNPTETIIMSIKEEYNPDKNTKNFEEVFDSYVKKNTTFTLDNEVKLHVQDCYKVGDNNNKWNAITNLYDRAKVSNGQEMFINYTSGYKSILGVPYIRSVSDDINKRMKDYFNNAGTNKYGISVMDFVDEDISRSIINTNF